MDGKINTEMCIFPSGNIPVFNCVRVEVSVANFINCCCHYRYADYRRRRMRTLDGREPRDEIAVSVSIPASNISDRKNPASPSSLNFVPHLFKFSVPS